MEHQDLIDEFYQTSAGKIISGKEAFRNKAGRLMHGLAYKHPKLMMAVGAAALLGGVAMGTAVAVAVSPIMFAGVYTGLSPKKNERAACETLANIAVKKTAALAHFLDRKKVPDDIQRETIYGYLMHNMPFGMAKEYLDAHHNAVADIRAGRISEACYHSPEVYKLEAVQEQFTKNQDKGGILHGMWQTFTKKYRDEVANATKIAEARWKDRETWERMGGQKPTWTTFMHAREFERETGKRSMMGTLAQSKMNHVTMAEMSKPKTVEKTPVKHVENNGTSMTPPSHERD